MSYCVASYRCRKMTTGTSRSVTTLARPLGRANAQIRNAQVGGFADTLGVVAKRAGIGTSVQPVVIEERTPTDYDRAPEAPESALVPVTTAQTTRAMWNTMNLKDRVVKSGIISAQEVAEVLGVSLTRARELVKGVNTSDSEQRAVQGRSGVSYQALIDTLYERRTKDSFAQAQKLVTALGLRRRSRQLQAVPDDGVQDEVDEENAS